MPLNEMKAHRLLTLDATYISQSDIRPMNLTSRLNLFKGLCNSIEWFRVRDMSAKKQMLSRHYTLVFYNLCEGHAV